MSHVKVVLFSYVLRHIVFNSLHTSIKIIEESKLIRSYLHARGCLEFVKCILRSNDGGEVWNGTVVPLSICVVVMKRLRVRLAVGLRVVVLTSHCLQEILRKLYGKVFVPLCLAF